MDPDQQTKEDKEDYFFTGHFREGEYGEELYKPPWRTEAILNRYVPPVYEEAPPLAFDCTGCGLYPREVGHLCERCYSAGIERTLSIYRLANVLKQLIFIPHPIHYHKAA